MILINRGTVLKIISVIPVTCLTKYLLFLGGGMPVEKSLSSWVIGEIFGTVTFGDIKILVMTMEDLFFLLLFNLLFGTYIYKEFGTSSVYVFSRLRNRSRWLIYKSLTLTFITAIYVVLYLCTLSVLISIHHHFEVVSSDIPKLFLLWFMLTLYTAIMTILINYLSIRFGSSIGFVLVFVLQLILLSVVIKYEALPETFLKPLALYGNPASMIVLGAENFTIQQGGLAFIDFLWLLILVLLGAIWINNYDIALSDQETSG